MSDPSGIDFAVPLASEEREEIEKWLRSSVPLDEVLESLQKTREQRKEEETRNRRLSVNLMRFAIAIVVYVILVLLLVENKNSPLFPYEWASYEDQQNEDLMTVLNPYNLNDFIRTNQFVFVKYLDSHKKKKELKNWTEMARKAREMDIRSVQFAYVDCSAYSLLCEYKRIQKYPTLVWYEYKKVMDVIEDPDLLERASRWNVLLDYAQQMVLQRCRHHSNSKLLTFRRFNEEFSTYAKYYSDEKKIAAAKIAKLTTRDEIDFFLAVNKYAFINFYAPWALWNDKWILVSYELARRVKEEKLDVGIALVDCGETGPTVCQHFFEIQKYPTLRWFEDSKSAPADYKGVRSVDALLEYVKNQLPDTMAENENPIPLLREDRDNSWDDANAIPLAEPLDEEEKEPFGEEEKEMASFTTSKVSLTEMKSATLLNSLEEFDSFLTRHEHAFIDFSTPWCVWCQRALPVWDEFAHQAEKEELAVGIAVVDCVAQNDLCHQQRILAFPSFRWFENGNSNIPRYKQTRSVEAFLEYAKKQLFDSETALKPDSQLSAESAAKTSGQSASASPPLPVLRGRLFYIVELRRHVIRGMWNYENSTVFPPQRFELIRTLSPGEEVAKLPQDGEFHGSFSLAYFHTNSNGKQQERSKIIPENGVKIKFRKIEGNDREYMVDGTGTNQFGIFHINGTVTPSSRDGDPFLNIVLWKRYEPSVQPPGSADTAPVSTSGSVVGASAIDENGPLPPPAQSFSSGVVCLCGKLSTKEEPNDLGITEVVHRISGMWASGLNSILADPDNSQGLFSRFEYEHKSSVQSKAIPVSGRYSGWFDFSNEDGSRTRINERDLVLAFRKNSAGYYNIEGKGTNAFGKYTITGTLTNDNVITIFRHFQPRKIENTAPPPVNGPQPTKAWTPAASLELKLNFDDVKPPDEKGSGEALEPIKPPADPTYSAVSRGVLRVNEDGSHSCQGLWAITREQFMNGQTSHFNFRLESHFAVEAASSSDNKKAFPLDSAMYKGSFQLKKQGSRDQTIVDQHIVMKFRINTQGSYNVYGKGVNAFGEFNLIGTLAMSGKTSGQVEVYRMYPEKKDDAVSSGRESAPDLTKHQHGAENMLMASLDKNNYESFMRMRKEAFVYFYWKESMDQHYLPMSDWIKFAEQIKAEGLSVALATMNCEEEPEMCHDEHYINKFPTLRWFTDGRAVDPDFHALVPGSFATELLLYAKRMLGLEVISSRDQDIAQERD